MTDSKGIVREANFASSKNKKARTAIISRASSEAGLSGKVDGVHTLALATAVIVAHHTDDEKTSGLRPRQLAAAGSKSDQTCCGYFREAPTTG